jgi:hypothetical protein
MALTAMKMRHQQAPRALIEPARQSLPPGRVPLPRRLYATCPCYFPLNWIHHKGTQARCPASLELAAVGGSRQALRGERGQQVDVTTHRKHSSDSDPQKHVPLKGVNPTRMRVKRGDRHNSCACRACE